MARPQLSVFIAASLDGYIATTDGSLDWLHAAARPEEDYGWNPFIASVDGLAMGRATYDHIADEDPWPFTGKPVFVFTHRPPPERAGITFWSASARDAVVHWAELGLQRVYVDGGRLIGQFLEHQLIDDLTITVIPLLLGDGARLFQPNAGGMPLELEDVTRFPSGIVILRYRRATS